MVIKKDGIKPKKEIIKLESIRVESGTNITPRAEVKVIYQGKNYSSNSTGDGPVDACFKAVDKITKLKPKLMQYKLEAITQGRDAQGLVRVELALDRRVVSGLSSSTDIIEASLKAYLDALNKLL